MSRIAIIGGGIVGIAIAHALTDEGHAVTVIDPPGVERRPSNGNAGLVAHNDMLPLNAAKVWRSLPRWLVDPAGPLSVIPSYAPRMIPWLLRFAAASRPARVEAGMQAMRVLNGAALSAWQRRLAPLELSGEIRHGGTLSVWRLPAGLAAAAPFLEKQRQAGITLEPLSAGAVRELEPALARDLAGGVLYPTGHHLCDPRQLVDRLTAAAPVRGITLLPGRVAGIAADDAGITLTLEGGATQRAERAVLAAGVWSRDLAATIGERVILDAERGYNLTFPPGSFGVSRPLVLESDGLTTTPLVTGDRIGGMVEFGGLVAPPRPARFQAILGKLKRYLPQAATADGRSWMGLRPSTPDSLPVLGLSRRMPRLVLAFGHGHYGMTQAALTGEIVAALIAGRAPPVSIEACAASRFGA